MVYDKNQVTPYPPAIQDIDSFPLWEVDAGTLTANATTPTIINSDLDGGGNPTCNFQNIMVGDYLESGGEIRKIIANFYTGPTNATRIDIESAFTVRPIAAPFHVIRVRGAKQVRLGNPIIIQYDANTTYFCYAPMGSNTSAPVWAVEKVIMNCTVPPNYPTVPITVIGTGVDRITLYAGGGAYNQIADNYLTLVYER